MFSHKQRLWPLYFCNPLKGRYFTIKSLIVTHQSRSNSNQEEAADWDKTLGLHRGHQQLEIVVWMWSRRRPFFAFILAVLIPHYSLPSLSLSPSHLHRHGHSRTFNQPHPNPSSHAHPHIRFPRIFYLATLTSFGRTEHYLVDKWRFSHLNESLLMKLISHLIFLFFLHQSFTFLLQRKNPGPWTFYLITLIKSE